MSPTTPSDPAAEAFERLRLEVALLRRAVEALAGEGREIGVDYSPTLAGLAASLDELATGLRALGARPALVLSPQQLVAVLQRAATQVLETPIAELARDREAFGRALSSFTAAQGREAHSARRRWCLVCAAGLAVPMAIVLIANLAASVAHGSGCR
jgi:hypothetical protein